VKIGQVDTEIALLIVKKEEINANKIYSPSGKFAKLKKLQVYHLHVMRFHMV